ncbi:DUF4097 family beta strand repeat-containing protein [Planococcus sp. ISL-109]|uniref:DUF4097 family beta strand repeat-containing protein n=1 Tax=Planococcus sp. ISL-109 TaxID=2819166 RepID=UPI001BE87FCA|nr:DUF4097 family beta strand repeat-containing protein [Planococcus sp. ISL-109]MBT2582856.1 DUF4097 family beta strand repeat protein [Planococcus sp. ISL-109]
MKTLVNILIIVASLFLIGVIVFLYVSYTSDPEQQEVLEEQTFDEEIEDMEITVKNSRVDVLPSNDGTFRIVLLGNNDDFTLNTDLSGTRLIIEVEERSRFSLFGFNHSSTLQVYVPANGLDSLSVDSTNGAIKATDIQAAELSLEANNGRIDLKAVESERVNAETANGRIELTSIEADMTVRASNGRIILTDVSGEIEARANNGRIDLTVDTLDFPVDLQTNNGHIEIHTENEPANARIQARVDNGSINVYGLENEQSTFGDGDVLIQLVSNNGRIIVE